MNLAKLGFWLFVSPLFAWILVWSFLPFLAFGGIAYLVFMGLSFIGVVLWFVFSLDRFVAWFKRRSTRFAMGLILTAVALFCILGFFNWLAIKSNVRKDMTANALHTLSDQTQRVVSGLSEEVVLRVWSTNVARMSTNIDVRGFLENYRLAGRGQLRVEILNPNEHFLEAEQDQIRRDNVIIVRALGSGREARVESLSDSRAEEQITNAIIQALKGEKKTVCFVVGHGQPALSDFEPTGLSTLRDALERSNYATREVPLVNYESIPEECELVANVGPHGAPTDRDQALLQAWLKSGAPFLALYGPRVPREWKDMLEKQWGLRVREDLLVDPNRYDSPVLIETRNYSSDNDLMQGFNLVTAFHEASSIRLPSEPAEGLRLNVLVNSESHIYAKAGSLTELRDLSRGQGDLRGPLPLAVLVESNMQSTIEQSPESPTDDVEARNQWNWPLDVFPKVHAQDFDFFDDEDDDSFSSSWARSIVYSSDLFAVNGLIRLGGNQDLILNSIGFLMQDEDLVGIRPRDLRETYLEITDQDKNKVVGFILISGGLFLLFGLRAARRKAVVA